MNRDLAKLLSTSEWHIHELGRDLEKQTVTESIFTLGNGYIGSRGVPEEIPRGARPGTFFAGTFFAGLFDATGAQVTELVNAPNPIALQVAVGGEKLGLAAMEVLDHRRILDMRRGALFRETLYRTVVGRRKVRYQSFRFFSMANPHVAVLRVAITPIEQAMTFTVRSVVDTSATNMGLVTEGTKRHFYIDAHETVNGANYLCTKTLEKEVLISYASMLTTTRNDRSRRQPKPSFEIRLEKNQTCVLTKYLSFYTSREVAPRKIRSKALGTLARSAKAGFDAVFRRHVKKWEELWRVSDIQIEGDSDLQRTLRFNVYHLLIAGSPHTPDGTSIGARCLSGEGYRGHVFWDTELFILPFFIHTAPDLARKFLMYRFHQLESARENALARGYAGAMFPWESADTGKDETPSWHKNFDGKVIEIHTMEQEHHITADVSRAVSYYFRTTEDTPFMLQAGLEMLLESARFWASRVKYNPQRRSYVINDVIGPDEFHENVNNNAYTNMMARWNLRIAQTYYEYLRRTRPGPVGRITKRLKLQRSELTRWREIEKKLYFPLQNPSGLIEQFDGYRHKRKYPLPDIDGSGLPRFPTAVELERLGATQFIKQADVVMLMYLLPELFTYEQIRKNFIHCEKRTLHKSSLSAPIHACVAARVGLRDLAYRYLRISAETDLKDVYGNTQEGIHAASLGGTWQAVVMGFCGLSVQHGVLHFDPHLPRQWRSLGCKISWKGGLLAIRVEQDTLTLHWKREKPVKRGGLRALPVRTYGVLHRLNPGKPYAFPQHRPHLRTIGTSGLF
jgi:kojibiose phosphorylase